MPTKGGLSRREQEQLANPARMSSFLFRVPTDLMETIKITAAKENRSINNMIQQMVMEGLRVRKMLRDEHDLPYQ